MSRLLVFLFLANALQSGIGSPLLAAIRNGDYSPVERQSDRARRFEHHARTEARYRPAVVSLTFASWNRLNEWLRRVDGVRHAA